MKTLLLLQRSNDSLFITFLNHFFKLLIVNFNIEIMVLRAGCLTTNTIKVTQYKFKTVTLSLKMKQQYVFNCFRYTQEKKRNIAIVLPVFSRSRIDSDDQLSA